MAFQRFSSFSTTTANRSSMSASSFASFLFVCLFLCYLVATVPTCLWLVWALSTEHRHLNPATLHHLFGCPYVPFPSIIHWFICLIIFFNDEFFPLVGVLLISNCPWIHKLIEMRWRQFCDGSSGRIVRRPCRGREMVMSRSRDNLVNETNECQKMIQWARRWPRDWKTKRWEGIVSDARSRQKQGLTVDLFDTSWHCQRVEIVWWSYSGDWACVCFVWFCKRKNLISSILLRFSFSRHSNRKCRVHFSCDDSGVMERKTWFVQSNYESFSSFLFYLTLHCRYRLIFIFRNVDSITINDWLYVSTWIPLFGLLGWQHDFDGRVGRRRMLPEYRLHIASRGELFHGKILEKYKM